MIQQQRQISARSRNGGSVIGTTFNR